MIVKPTPDGIANLILPALTEAFNSHKLTSPREADSLCRAAVVTAVEIRKALAAEIDGYADIRQRQADTEESMGDSLLLRGEEQALRNLAAVLRGDKTKWE